MPTTDRPRLLSSSSLNDTPVKNMSGDDIGRVEDMMIHLATGRIAYVVMSFGGFLGMGEKWFAVPFGAFKLDTKKECLLLDVEKETLERAEGFDKDNWPDFADVDFHGRLHQVYGARPVWSN